MDYLAQITNPATSRFGSLNNGAESPGSLLASIIVTIWTLLIVLGGLAVLIFLLMGALNWLTAGGDKAKVEAARDRITNALVGMAILFASIAFVNFIGPAIGFDLLQLQLPNNLPTN